jgi:hypothetical protein
MKRNPFLLSFTSIIIYFLVVLLAVGVVVWLLHAVKQTEVSIVTDQHIDLTPEQVTSIKAIGEWEFLAIANEELVDTVRKRLLKDDHLARIYYGTLRLGINMHQVKPGWIAPSGDSIEVTLPKIGLLDRDFIDEARTKSFFESGSWSHEDREKLYHQAYQKMLNHCLTPENLQQARQNGEEQFRNMMKTLGYEHILIRWEE